MPHAPLRPVVRFLSGELRDRILGEARDALSRAGIEVGDPGVARRLLESGATREAASGRLRLPGELIERSLVSVPRRFTLHDREGAPCATLGAGRVHFTPGSSAASILDEVTLRPRPPLTSDYIRYVRLVERLPGIDYPSTAFIPSDVPPGISDSWRLYLSLLHGTGPVVTGAFGAGSLRVMRDLLVVIRGDARRLADRPLAVFSCCPAEPLRWSADAAANLSDCAHAGIPAEIVPAPVAGFTAPGTLATTLAQHAAAVLGGIVISQTESPGAPLLWGAAPAVFDFRHETTPVGAAESQMLACASAEIGRHLGLPTQAYMGGSDARTTDAQSGFESASGILLAALSGIDSVSGPGMLDTLACQSLLKLALDDEICAAARRLIEGISEREGDFPFLPHLEGILSEGHAIIADHTRRWYERDVRFPGPAIARSRAGDGDAGGPGGIEARLRGRIDSLLAGAGGALDEERRRALEEIMERAARDAGLEELPPHGT